MKRNLFWPLVVTLCLLAAALSLWLPYHAASRRVSDLYRRYADNPHLTVAHIEGFWVNNTLTLDVTALQATDSAGWETLKKDFNIPTLPDSFQQKIDKGIDITSIRLVPKADPSLPMDTTDLLNNNVIAISRLHHTLSVFYTHTREEQNAIRRSQIELGLPNIKKTTKNEKSN